MKKPIYRFIYERYMPKFDEMIEGTGEQVTMQCSIPSPNHPLKTFIYHETKDKFSGWFLYGDILKIMEEIEKYYGGECFYIRNQKVIRIDL